MSISRAKWLTEIQCKNFEVLALAAVHLTAASLWEEDAASVGKRIRTFRGNVVSHSISTLGNIEIRLPLDVASYPDGRNPPQIGLSFLSYRRHWTMRYSNADLTHWQWQLDIRWHCSGKERRISKPLNSSFRVLFSWSVIHLSDFYSSKESVVSKT